MTIARMGLVAVLLIAWGADAGSFGPGQGSMLSAHNCYPYHGLWADRIDRALETGTPLAIEQDLCWVKNGSGGMVSVVAHNGPFDGKEPTLREYFFERVRPIVERAMSEAQTDPGAAADWPLIVLDLDIKDNERAHLDAINALLREFEPWLTSAARTADLAEVSPLDVRPIMVLVGGGGVQRAVFHDEVAVGGRVIAFGRCDTRGPDTEGLTQDQRAEAVASFPAASMVVDRADNFRRWWNNSWHVVEAGGAPGGGAWTEADAARLGELVEHAHAMGYFIRFYTVNGHSAADAAVGGYSPGYNTGSVEAARARWEAMRDAGVDFIATDQYHLFDAALRPDRPARGD